MVSSYVCKTKNYRTATEMMADISNDRGCCLGMQTTNIECLAMNNDRAIPIPPWHNEPIKWLPSFLFQCTHQIIYLFFTNAVLIRIYSSIVAPESRKCSDAERPIFACCFYESPDIVLERWRSNSYVANIFAMNGSHHLRNIHYAQIEYVRSEENESYKLW